MTLFAVAAGEGSGCSVVSALSLPSVLLAVALEQIADLVGVGLHMQSGILSPSCKCCLRKAPTAHRLFVCTGGTERGPGEQERHGRGLGARRCPRHRDSLILLPARGDPVGPLRY